jgi:hypothetical protein
MRAFILAVVVAGAVVLAIRARSTASSSGGAGSGWVGTLDFLGVPAADAPGDGGGADLSAGAGVLAQLGAAVKKLFTPPKSAAPYLEAITQAEQANNLPPTLLARVLYQESRFRPEIINGTVKSKAGAIGIAQIVPKWHPGVNPYNPTESIAYAAGYLRQLFNQFGSWDKALAAYNWGPGNLKAAGLDRAPAETRDYVAQIGADVSLEA